MNKGDILFWTTEGATYPDTPAGRWQRAVDTVIQRRTDSPIVHCEVAWEHGYSVGALSGGVALHEASGYAYLASTSSSLPNIDAASKWLLGMLGTLYGFGDVFNQALNLLPGSPSIALDKSADCSDLCVRFLTYGGYALPPTLTLSPQEATPGELFRVLSPVKV